MKKLGHVLYFWNVSYCVLKDIRSFAQILNFLLSRYKAQEQRTLLKIKLRFCSHAFHLTCRDSLHCDKEDSNFHAVNYCFNANSEVACEWNNVLSLSLSLTHTHTHTRTHTHMHTHNRLNFPFYKDVYWDLCFLCPNETKCIERNTMKLYPDSRINNNKLGFYHANGNDRFLFQFVRIIKSSPSFIST